jgi:indolepyruvate ferredoxin oxidoreductase
MTTLDDKYDIRDGRVFLTGTQALVRLPLMQRRRDLATGRNTAGFISGYRGSPLGAYDRELWKAREQLAAHHVTFTPGLNEDLAASAVWGSQQVGLNGKSRYDGVFGLWYGKGPGLDRAGDAMRHANAAGTTQWGGVLAVVGDDHNLKSSTQPAHGEPTFADLQMPVLYPAGLPEIVLPPDLPPPGLVALRWPDPWSEAEMRFHRHKLPAMLSFARANRINRVALEPDAPRFGIVAAGKSWTDLRQALADLGLDDRALKAAGIRLIKIGMPWPLDPAQLVEFCGGLEEVLVIEEKRQLIEDQLRTALYALPDGRRPLILGRHDARGNEILPRVGEHDPDICARVIAAWLADRAGPADMAARLDVIAAAAKVASGTLPLKRGAYFCSGCPHNSSTKVPEGSRAVAGIGCHYMAVSADRSTATFTQMGGEGTTWIGQSPFVDEPHIFANVGDGTYFHSAHLAVRACVAAGMTMTFKVLFNDAVAMTGGQPLDGTLTVPRLVRQLQDEGVVRVVVVADDPSRYPGPEPLPAGIVVEPRSVLDRVQRELREIKGVTALVYDQVCAAEKRRRRKRGAMPDPDRRIFVNRAVCEGCGDCSKASNCLSVTPVDTEFGRRRRIDQSGCNKDFSCSDGFCPSFVVVEGATRPRSAKPDAIAALAANLPDPVVPALPAGRPYGMLVTGIGGTGVVTVGAILGMAAHIEGKAARLVDVLGMAQKGGGVLSHIRIAGDIDTIAAPKLNAGAADLLLGCDLMGAAETGALNTVRPGMTRAIVNTAETPTGAFTLNPDLAFPGEQARDRIAGAVGPDRLAWVDANALAERLVGDTVAANMLMLGHAWQSGLVPVGLPAIDEAIALNGVAIGANRQAFLIGRLAAARPEVLAAPADPVGGDLVISATLDDLIARRVAYLTAYQDAAYAQRYRVLVERVRATLGNEVARGVAESYFRLLAYKDEYEVARLYSTPEFRAQLAADLVGEKRLSVLLAPPLLARIDPDTGRPRKRAFGPWVFSAFRVLARLKGLRGTAFDPFGYTAERREERQLIAEFEQMVEALLPSRLPAARLVEIVRAPLAIRGFGPVKQASIEAYRKKAGELAGP